MSIKTDLVVKHVRKSRKWELMEEFRYETKKRGTIVVPKGYVTDGASVPRGLWNLFPPNGKYLEAAVVHDYIYTDLCSVYTKEEADNIFVDVMEELGIAYWRRQAMWLGVHLGGKGNWPDDDNNDGDWHFNDLRPS